MADKHWTQESADAMAYSIAASFICQIETLMETTNVSQAGLALSLGVSESRVSQIINNPTNITLSTAVRLAKAFGLKVALLAYADGDPNNEKGPIIGEVFEKCWLKNGKPRDLFEFAVMTGPAAQESNT